MRTDVDVNELPARLNEILALVHAGQEIVIVADGTPRAQLIPMQAGGLSSTKPRIPVLGLRPDAIILAPDFNDALPDEFWLGER